MASILIAAAAAAADGCLAAGPLALTVLGIFFIEVAKNASGEIFDLQADRGVLPEERTPFSGGKRVLVDGLMTARQTWAAAIGCYALGAIVGGLLAVREPRILPICLLGLACAYFYQGWPIRLCYRGFGELTVGLAYGPLIAAGTYLVQCGRLTPRVILAAIPLGILIAAFLVLNELPDERADRSAGKRNLVVRLGGARARFLFTALFTVAVAVLGLLPLAGLPRTVWLGAICLVPGIPAVGGVLRHFSTPSRLLPAQRLTLIAFLLLSVGVGAGLMLGAP